MLITHTLLEPHSSYYLYVEHTQPLNMLIRPSAPHTHGLKNGLVCARPN